MVRPRCRPQNVQRPAASRAPSPLPLARCFQTVPLRTSPWLQGEALYHTSCVLVVWCRLLYDSVRVVTKPVPRSPAWARIAFWSLVPYLAYMSCVSRTHHMNEEAKEQTCVQVHRHASGSPCHTCDTGIRSVLGLTVTAGCRSRPHSRDGKTETHSCSNMLEGSPPGVGHGRPWLQLRSPAPGVRLSLWPRLPLHFRLRVSSQIVTEGLLPGLMWALSSSCP